MMTVGGHQGGMSSDRLKCFQTENKRCLSVKLTLALYISNSGVGHLLHFSLSMFQKPATYTITFEVR